jgi:D-alanyl-D-alanine carboxypeptidase/D-alanyl-D-alanine-endopeptidase (penicillin-binding protein 4)
MTAIVIAIALSACHARPAVTPAPPRPDAIAELRHDIDAILGVPAFDRTYWGVLIKSLETDEALYSVNASKLMMPGSTLKVVTLAVAAERLGWDYTYGTRVLATGKIDNGILRGDLIVVGSGDPTIVDADGMAARLFDAWAEKLKAAGIRAIEGRIVGDDNVFDDDGLGSGWAWDDVAAAFAAAVGGLQFNDNVVQLTIAPGATVGSAPTVTVAPSGSGLVVQNLLKTSAAGTAPSIEARRSPGSARLDLRGSIPLGGGAIARSVSVDNPTLFFVTALRSALIAHGVDVRGPAVDIDDITDAPFRNDARSMATYRSPPLSALAMTLMKISQNLYAETLLKTIAAAGGTPTSDNGRTIARTTLQRWGVQPGGLIQVDGSGLSRYNYLTSDTLVTILTHVDRDQRLREPFEAALPIAGRDGTLAARMRGTAAEGNARAKTGTLQNVRGLAGFVTTAGDERVVFSILANNFDAPPDAVLGAIDAIVVRLARFSRR